MSTKSLRGFQHLERLTLAAAVSLAAGVASPVCNAQCQPGWLSGLQVPNLNGEVRAMVEMANGDVMVVGRFSTVGGITARNAAIFTPSTGAWRPAGFGVEPQYDSSVMLALEPGGTVLMAGTQPTVPGDVSTGLSRFDPVSGVWTRVYSGLAIGGTSPRLTGLLARPNGDIWIAGDLIRFGPGPTQTLVRVARYAAATNQWTYWNYPPLSNLLVRPNGELVATPNPFPAQRYNSTSDTWSSWNIGFSGPHIAGAAVLPGGDIAIAGFFTGGGVAINGVGRYSPETNTWSQLGSIIPNTPPHDLVVTPAGELVATGAFTSIGGVNAPHVAAFNFGTNTWRGLGTEATTVPQPLIALQDGTLLAYGDFQSTLFNPEPTSLRRYIPATNAWEAGSAGRYSAGAISDGFALPDGQAIVIGDFATLEGVRVRNIARYVPGPNQTHTWSPVAEVNGSINTIIQDSANTAIIGGAFTTVGGVACSRVARINLVTGQAEPLGQGTSGTVNSVAQLPSGLIAVTGYFSTAGGRPAASIAFFDPATTQWTVPNQGLANGTALGRGYDAKVFPDGTLVIAGLFDQVAGVPARSVARYSPQTNTWSAVDTNITSGSFNWLYPLPNGDALAFANLALNGTASVSGTYRYSAADNSWALNATQLGSFRIRPLHDGKLLCGFGALVRVYDASQETISTIGTAMAASGAGVVGGLELTNHDIIVSGRFDAIDGSPASNVAVYSPTPAPVAILTASPALSLCTGSSGWLSVQATGVGPFTYAWRHDGTPISTLSNPTSNTSGLILSNIQAADAGVYDCVVSNACGDSAPQAFQVVVLPPNDPGCLTPPACDPDVNHDGVADQGDIDYLISIVAGGENPERTDPDFNRDGVADQGDIDALINAVGGGGCP